MSCTNCGSNLPCGCSQQVQTGVGRTCVDPCGVPAGCNPNQCCSPSLPGSPIPFYACTPSCPESHTQTLVQQQFYFDISAVNTWNVPTCGNTAVLAVPGIKSINIGSYIWDSEFGYFEVTAFDVTTGQITVVNHCNEDNAAPGTSVPACTLFTVTDPPPPDTPTTDTCVAIDFTAPSVCPDVGCCINITLTNLGAISAGDSIQIGAGRYSVDSIVSSEVITICNDLGLGLVPGTPVIALDAAGNYQYCITIAQSCCSQIEEEFPDGLTPCSDFENDRFGSSVATNAQDFNVPGSTTVNSTATTVVIANESSCRAMSALINAVAHIDNVSTTDINMDYDLQEQVDGGGYVTLKSGTLVITGFVRIPIDVSYSTVITVAAGASTTYNYRINITNNLGGSPPDVECFSVNVTTSVLGIAV